jgi:cytoskeletal protein RodZ
MSLINDALKRAKAAQQPSLPAPKLEFRPVSDSVPAGNSASRALLVGMLGLFLVVGLLVFRLASHTSVRSITANASSPAPVAAGVQPPTPAPLSTVQVTETPTLTTPSSPASPAPVRAAPLIAAAVTSAADQATNTAAAPEAASPKPAAPKIQAIVFDPTRPSAIINGRTVFVGGKVAGGKVLRIDQDSVTLLAAGQTNVLTLEQ